MPGAPLPVPGGGRNSDAPPVIAGNPFAGSGMGLAAMPSMGAVQMPAVSLDQAGKDIARRDQLINEGSGVSRIQSPWLHGAAATLDTIGRILAPNIEQQIKGTQGNHQLLLGQQENIIRGDLSNNLQQTQNQDSLAQVAQRQALAQQEISKSQALQNPRPQPGHLVMSPDGSAAGYQDADGNLMGLNDPSVPKGVKDVAGNMAPKATKVPLAEQPLDAAEAARLNGLWDGLADKHHLPKGQFVTGMSRADATSLAAGLNNVVGKQQGDTHVSISLQGMQNQTQRQSGNNALDTSDPAMQASIAAVANGSMKLTDVFGRGATTALKSQFVAAVKDVNPAYNSGDHDIENGVRKYMTSGQGGATLNAGATVTHHLDLYDKAVDALHNGDMRAINAVGNELGIQMGSDAQTNVNLIRQGVATESAKFYKGGPPDASEIHEYEKNLSGDGSPQQMHGGAATVRGMVHGKMQAMQSQYQAGQQGQPNFGQAANSGGGVSPEGTRAQMQDGSFQVKRGGKWVKE